MSKPAAFLIDAAIAIAVSAISAILAGGMFALFNKWPEIAIGHHAEFLYWLGFGILIGCLGRYRRDLQRLELKR